MTEENKDLVIPKKGTKIALGVTSKKLAELVKTYKKVPNANTGKGYEEIKEAKRILVPIRTKVEAEAKLQKKAAQDHINSINKVKNVIIETIQKIEAPLYLAKKKVDDAVELEKQKKILDEQKRVADIEEKIVDIQSFSDGLLGTTVEYMEERKEKLEAIEITPDIYMEFVDAATAAKNQVRAQMVNAMEGAKKLAADTEELKRKQKIQDDKEAEMDKRQKALDDKEKEQEERDRIVREEEREKKNKEELESRLPQDVKIRKYADSLLKVKVPQGIDDNYLSQVMLTALNGINAVRDTLYKATQGDKSE